MSIHRLLAIGPHSALHSFHFGTCARLNAIRRRENTFLYTCMPEDLEFALVCAKQADVTAFVIEFGKCSVYLTPEQAVALRDSLTELARKEGIES